MAKSSLDKKDIVNVETPKIVELDLDNKTSVVAKSSAPVFKGDEDAPFILAADDSASRQYSVYDDETDRLLVDAFYANRATGNILVALKTPDGKPVIVRENENGPEQPLLVLKNRKVYFKKNLSI